MRKIRTNTFETNSSSVHTIIITKSHIKIPEPCELVYGYRRFNVENREYWDWRDKVVYFHLACSLNSDSTGLKLVEEFEEFLSKYGIAVVRDDELGYSDIDWYEELIRFTEILLENPSILEAFLFGENSRIYTGSDGDNSKAVKLADKICPGPPSYCGSGFVRIPKHKKSKTYAYVKGY